ncbi:MAG: type II toxin-antitoxin system RelE/ParE family toxin [Woeseia sp.]|nr:type II toxin-antitoxin system RelE/ParE family toxin [Woeseia sp.]
MTPFQILSGASAELEACVNYYNSQHPQLGTEFLTEFENTAERIIESPNAARVIATGVRSRPIHRFPFYVLYRSTVEEITIVAIAHRRRRPNYWVGRK